MEGDVLTVHGDLETLGTDSALLTMTSLNVVTSTHGAGDAAVQYVETDCDAGATSITGTFTLHLDGITTGQIDADADDATVQAEINAAFGGSALVHKRTIGNSNNVWWVAFQHGKPGKVNAMTIDSSGLTCTGTLSASVTVAVSGSLSHESRGLEDGRPPTATT